MMRRLLTMIAVTCAALTATPAPASAATLAAQLEEAVRVRAGLSTAARVTISDVRASDRSDPSDARVTRLTLPEGERGIGLVAARIELVGASGAPETTWIRARVRVEAPALVATRPLPRGTVVRMGDLEAAMIPLRADHVGAQHEAIGRRLEHTLRPGDPVRARWLRAPVAMERGTQIRAVVRRGAVVAESDAEALQDGAAGEIVRIRMAISGRTARARVVDARRVEVLR